MPTLTPKDFLALFYSKFPSDVLGFQPRNANAAVAAIPDQRPQTDWLAIMVSVKDALISFHLVVCADPVLARSSEDGHARYVLLGRRSLTDTSFKTASIFGVLVLHFMRCVVAGLNRTRLPYKQELVTRQAFVSLNLRRPNEPRIEWAVTAGWTQYFSDGITIRCYMPPHRFSELIPLVDP